MIRALFLDLDGTLVGAENTVSPRSLAAVRAARERGCEVVLCTGRSRVSTEPVADQLGFRGTAVVSNGAVLMRLDTREVLACHRIPVPTALAAVRRLMQAGAPPQVYEDAIESARILYHPDHPVGVHNPDRQRPWARLAEELPFAPICISSFGPEARYRPIAERLAADPPAGTFVEQAGTHATWCLEVHPLESGKGNGVRRVTEHLGLRPDEVMAIGDHLNDIGMLQYAGIGVAMGNALPETRAAADWVAGTLAEEGVAQAIERFVLD